MGGDVQDLRTDLVFLRKGPGFTPTRIGNAGTLTLLLGGADEPFEHLRERFVSAIQSLRDPEPDLLMNAFALNDQTAHMTNLRQRREHYGETIERKVDTVADREDAALVHLATQLLTGWYPASPLGVRVPELHNGIVLERVSVLTVVNDRKWQETREHYRFLALFDEADYLTISSSYPGTVTTDPAGPFTARTRRINDSYSHDFTHTTPMRRGQTYDLRFKVGPDEGSDEPRTILEASRAFHERTLTATIEVVFIGEKPQTIWAFERLSYFERPGTPERGACLDFADTASVRASWSDVYGGLFNGVAWRW